MDDQKNYKRAKKRVEEKMSFFIHLAVFIGVNILLLVINLTTSSHVLWSLWAFLGWGIGLVSHALKVFLLDNPSLKQRMIEKEMKKEG